MPLIYENEDQIIFSQVNMKLDYFSVFDFLQIEETVGNWLHACNCWYSLTLSAYLAGGVIFFLILRWILPFYKFIDIDDVKSQDHWSFGSVFEDFADRSTADFAKSWNQWKVVSCFCQLPHMVSDFVSNLLPPQRWFLFPLKQRGHGWNYILFLGHGESVVYKYFFLKIRLPFLQS